MPGGDRKVERFLILNGLQPGERLAAGRLVKLLAER